MPILACLTNVLSSLTKRFAAHLTILILNPILHTPWLENHALTLKCRTAKYYFDDNFLHT